MTLRARLVAALLALAAAGLVVLGVVTYASQRSFLGERVDQQARTALPAVGQALEQRNGGRSASGPGAPPGPGGAPADPRQPPGGDPPSANLPPGTYGQRRDGAGRRIGKDVTLSYGQRALAKPQLPARLAPGQRLTVDGRGDSGPRYRVLVARTPMMQTLTVVAVPLRENDQTLDRLLLVEGVVIGVVLLLLAAGSWLLVGFGLRPLGRMGATAERIAAGELSRRVEPADGRSEVGRLGRALNAMLARLESAFAEQRASEERLRSFLADASHELRTPLASIRGYAELFRIGAAGDQRERAEALRRIEQEAERMGVLVEDLLTLARLDEPRERRSEPVELGAVTADAVSDARVQASDRQVALSAPRGELVVAGDRDQLGQVLANLLANALSHTPAGSPIDVSLDRVDGRALIVVRDHGPGLPAAASEEVFGRFWRSGSERGRGRGPAGAGLGLAIVAAVVEAHGGSVAAADADGGGAAFTVTLPLADAAPAGSVAAQ